MPDRLLSKTSNIKHEVTMKELKMALEKMNCYSEQFFDGDYDKNDLLYCWDCQTISHC